MKLRKNLGLSLAALALCFAGCNLFNPIESVNISSTDADALTYEGYIKFRDNNYTEAEEYFLKAIEADQTHSEAWYGLIKAKMNLQDINTFELLKYVNLNQGTTVPFADMNDEVAYKYKVGIDTVVKYAKAFIQLDTTGQLDGKITYKTISNGYMVLQLTQTMLSLRKTTKIMDGCNVSAIPGQSKCDIASVLNTLKNNSPEEAVETFHEVFKICQENPDALAAVFSNNLQGFNWLAEDKKGEAVSSMCGALANTTENTGTTYNETNALNIIIGQFGFSDAMDDDGDGCIDEEIYDGADNDGDGLVDEDIRDQSNSIVYDDILNAKNAIAKKTEIKYLRIVKDASPNEKYEVLDLDKNGYIGKDDRNEWEYAYKKFDDRDKNNNFLLKFAQDLKFNPQGLPLDQFLELKNLVAKDTDINNIQYDLNFRKQYIGGCWVNYNQDSFRQWFEGRGL